MRQRGVTLLHTLVILFAGMIAAGGVAAFASFTYRTAADQELSIKAQFVLEGAIEQAKWKIWNQELALGGSDTVTIDGATATISLTDTNSFTASTWRADAEVVVEGRSYSLSRTIGLATFPKERVNWVYNPENKHYYAMLTVRAGMDFSTALANAKELRAPDGKSGYLGTITNESEWKWVRERMLPTAGKNTVVTGGYRQPEAEKPTLGWRWMNGEGFSYEDWHYTDPDIEKEEAILGLNADGSQQFHDLPNVSGYTTFLVEAGDWVNWVRDYRTGRHYAFVPAAGMTWQEAKNWAEMVGGPYGEPTSLLSITTSYEAEFVSSKLMEVFEKPASGWIGAHQTDTSGDPSLNWTWASGEPWGFTKWAQGHPANKFGDDHGVEMSPSGEWSIVQNTAETVVGYWIEAGKPLEWHYYEKTDHWYAIMPVEGGLSWSEASKWAQELVGPNGEQGYLASLTLQEEHELAVKITEPMKRADGEDLWDDWGWAVQGPYFGLKQFDLSDEPAGGWAFTTGEAMGFKGWGLGLPDDWDKREHFATLLLDDAGWGWNDCIDESWAKGFVVEAGEPPFVWKQWKKSEGGNDHWYAFVKPPDGMSWDQASSYAKGLVAPNGENGYLVTFTSQAEHSWAEANLIPPSPKLTSPHNGISWFGARQEPGSQESKTGWVYDNGESLITYWGQYSYNEDWREPNDSTTSLGAVSNWTKNEDAGLLYYNAPTLSFGNYWNNAGYLTSSIIVESGTPSQLKLLESRWKTVPDGASNPHPDTKLVPFWLSDFSGSLGPYEWPILSQSGKDYGFQDWDAQTSEILTFTPGSRGGGREVFMENEGKASLPLDAVTSETTGFFPTDANGGKRQQHFKGTFYLADSTALSTVQISMKRDDDDAYVYINGSFAFEAGGSLTERSLLKVGDNRIDLFVTNYGGAGANNLSISVPVKPYAKPFSVLHPNQFALSMQHSMSLAGPTPYSVLKVEGNVYSGLGSTNLAWGTGSKIDGYLYTTVTAPETMLPHDYRVSGVPAITWPDYSTADWHKSAAATFSSGSVITNPAFSSNGAMLSSSGTLNVSGVYSGRGAIHADTVIITGHLRPATPDSLLSIIAREVRFGSSSWEDHYVDAVVFAQTTFIVRPTILTGSLATKALSMQSAQYSNLTIRQRDLVWRSKALAKELKIPGYWKPSSLTGTYYRYVGMGDGTPNELTGGTIRWTLGGRLNSSFRPYASPVGRTWHKPTLQMTEASMPSRQLNWWTTSSKVIQEKVQQDTLPFSNPYPWWPDGGSSLGTRGVWWTGGFDAASQAEIDSMTFNIAGSDDMTAVYINGRLALDHGGKHSETWAGPSLTDRSMIQIGQNRIDIFMADLSGGGAINMSSNITFYPTPPTVPSFTATDDPYNWGLYTWGPLDMKFNMDVRGDVMQGSGWKRSAGTQTFHGITWTNLAARPAGPTYLGHSITSTALLALPALPPITEYATRANVTVGTTTLGPQTNNTAVPRLYYRSGKLTLSGTAPWKGYHVIVVSVDATVSGALNLADQNSGVVIISYRNLFLSLSGATANVTAYCLKDIKVNSASTIIGSLWSESILMSASLNLWQNGDLCFNPDRRRFFKLPGYFP